MSFIRTKDNIYENNGLMQSNSTVEENAIIVCGGHFAIPVSNIIKQAEEIKDLCDRFIVYVEDLDYYAIFDYYDEAFSNFDAMEHLGHVCKFFGVLETDKGLIYAAKMNDEGELCLI